MAPPNESKPTPKVAATAAAAAPKLTTTGSTAVASKAATSSSSTPPCLFSLRDDALTVGGGTGKAAAVALLTGVPGNVTLTPFAEAFYPTTKASSDAPEELASQAAVNARRGAFLGFTLPSLVSRAPCHVGRLPCPRRFLSVFWFKTWWSTVWARRRGWDLQMET